MRAPLVPLVPLVLLGLICSACSVTPDPIDAPPHPQAPAVVFDIDGTLTPDVHTIFGVREDAAACRAALSAAWDVTITPVDTCSLVSLRGDKYAAVREVDNPLVQALLENYRLWWKNHPNNEENPLRPRSSSSILYDTVAVPTSFVVYRKSL